ncbi:YHYH protein [Bauldia litoralis]|uniref:YHYH protein n=1 Tax=Bauldia litoralis TaxID=665467 RepID=A0A1G6DFH6_9HYPH|nr:YHYH protein [Bauldia litoralis]SDB43888.1 YHYH protein [Bauldia litoralis]
MTSLHLRPLTAVLPFIVAACAAQSAAAHDDRCAVIAASVEEAGFSDTVSVICEGGHASIVSDTYPDHEMMTGIVGTNEQVPVPAVGYAAPIPLETTLRDTPQTRDASLGVAVNGVPIYDYTAGGEMTEADLHHHQTRHDTLTTHQLDVCGGHAGRGDDYHYHVKPTCMIEQMENAGDDAVIGWAYDGFPIYGDNNPDGTAIAKGDLDVCNGQPDATFGYRYHTSEDAPYIVQCLMGEVADFRSLPRVAPLRGADAGPGPTPGVPPRGGVQDLVFTESDDGERRMDYTYEGEAYYIHYRPSDRPDCYDFETRTVTNGGAVQTGEYCR